LLCNIRGGLCDVECDCALTWTRALQCRELAGEKRRRHEMPLARSDALFKQCAAAIEKDKGNRAARMFRNVLAVDTL
jgi:hypothetical protein